MANDDEHSDEFAKRLAELLASKVAPVPVKKRGPSVGFCSILCVLFVGLVLLGSQAIADSHKGVKSSQDALARVETGTSAPYVAPVVPIPAYVAPSSSDATESNQHWLQQAWDAAADHSVSCTDRTPDVFAYNLWKVAQGRHLGADGKGDIPLGDYIQFFETACAKWSVTQR
jgi:hypothetical protein